MYVICLIPGDGIGQEVIPAARRVLEAILPDTRFILSDAGWECFLRHGTSLPLTTTDTVARADGTLFGATQSPSRSVAGYRSPILALRRDLDLYANLRPAAELVASRSGGQPIDLLIVRENTEGLYAGRERRDGDTAVAERVITRRASERIARVAFEQARRRSSRSTNRRIHGSRRATAGRSPFAGIVPCGNSPVRHPLVTIVHKANVLKLTDGLFRDSCLQVAEAYPDVEVEEMLVDTAAMRLAREPQRFDVILTTNLFGDILSDLAAGLVGGLGVAPSGNVGDRRPAVFEPVHGSAPDIAGLGIANPIGAILSAAMLLEHLGEDRPAQTIREAVTTTVAEGITTPDLGGSATTEEVVDAVLERLPRRSETAASPGVSQNEGGQTASEAEQGTKG